MQADAFHRKYSRFGLPQKPGQSPCENQLYCARFKGEGSLIGVIVDPLDSLTRKSPGRYLSMQRDNSVPFNLKRPIMRCTLDYVFVFVGRL